MEKKSPVPEYSPPGVLPPPGYTAVPGVAPPPGNYNPSTSLTCTPTIKPVFGPNPQIVHCPSCNQQVTTNVKAESSSKTHLMAVLLCLVSCCCLPYLIDSCKNKNHYCPSCGVYLGVYNN